MRALAPVLLLLLAIAGCGESDAPPGRAAAPEPSVTPFPTVAFADLNAGVEYEGRAFRPPVRLTLPATGGWNWKVASADTPDHLEVEVDPERPVVSGGFGFHRMTKVFPAAEGGVEPGDATEAPEDFAAYLTSHPHLETTKPERVELLGLEGVRLDIRVKSSQPRKYRDCGKYEGDCVVLYVGGIETYVYGSDVFGRFYVLEQPDGRELVVEQFVEPARAAKRLLPVFDEALATASLGE